LRELPRAVRPGGRVLLSVPYGERIDMGWQRQSDLDVTEDAVYGDGADAVVCAELRF